ncbi:MAG TPA: aminoacyl-tRNA hydrolase [Thermohalobaculum sp.]|nr:aminoacyl-tRNA hydrolase [Thermohalobaculum sp.]
MRLFVGLGNPGPKHAGQRHNIGFMAVDAIAAEHGFGPWRSRFRGEAADGRLGAERVMLLKPQTYMNNSGQSVGEAMRYLKLDPADVVVFHDELDLAPGKLRLKSGGGHAGHNGLRSLHQHIGEGYARVRLGIGHPGAKDLVTRYVLHDFAKADAAWLEPLLEAVARAAPRLAGDDGGRFQNEVALAMQKAPPTDAGTEAPEAPAPAPRPAEEPARNMHPLQRLVQHFSGKR